MIVFAPANSAIDTSSRSPRRDVDPGGADSLAFGGDFALTVKAPSAPIPSIRLGRVSGCDGQKAGILHGSVEGVCCINMVSRSRRTPVTHCDVASARQRVSAPKLFIAKSTGAEGVTRFDFRRRPACACTQVRAADVRRQPVWSFGRSGRFWFGGDFSIVPCVRTPPRSDTVVDQPCAPDRNQ